MPGNTEKLSKKILYNEALEFHRKAPAGKIEIVASKRLNDQHDLALAYSPGVAAPCEEIYADPNKVYEYTSKGNMVAVISNGTAVLGLGNLGPAASKPVMEGKCVLFKRFGGVDAIDIEVETESPDDFIKTVSLIGNSWGGINLEDIKAPECFVIEEKLQEMLDIPVFHDDQHGTAIICAAGLLNACELQEKKLEDLKVVVSGAGSASISCVRLLKKLGVRDVIICDTKGVIYKGRKDGMNSWKEEIAVETNARTMADAFVGSDVFIGVSVKGVVTKEMVKSMNNNPIIFAMANPDPEISPEEVKEVRSDAIIATGRSDYPNQVNNVMGFPYIFRGALDVNARKINDEMKLAAVYAIAALAKEDVPYEVSAAYAGRRLQFGPEYIIPTPFDSRLIQVVPSAVADAAIKSGVARKNIADFDAYRKQLAARLNPTSNLMNIFFEELKRRPKRMIFTEGDDEQMIRAAIQWRNRGYGTPILIGHSENIKKKLKKLGSNSHDMEILNSANHENTEGLIDQLYNRMQRKGYTRRDCARLVKRDRNTFSALLLQNGEGHGMITGLSRAYSTSLEEIMKVVTPEPGKLVFGLSIILKKGKTIFIADTSINELPEPDELAEIAIQSAQEARKMGHVPRVAFLSFSNFGNPMKEMAERMRQAVACMDRRTDVDFEYEGEIQADVALRADLLELYPFARLTEPANILIMPGLHSAHIATLLLKELGEGILIGPLLSGMSKSVQIVNMGATEADILNLAAIGVHRSE
jgi:malate dehydrogenase (oxaloacetate-decarboxylating)(NADP+)